MTMQTESLALLLINGSEPCARKLALYLTSQGLLVTAVADEIQGQLEARARPYDCVLVDLGWPDKGHGVPLVRALRGENEVPIVLIAPGNEVSDRVAALEAGADDCVSAWCSERELLSRILASVRRVRRHR